jgi:predicted PhzF superfamily epimerase YddE/YHI9
LANESTLRALQPNLGYIGALKRGVVVTCRAETNEFDFISRNFLPHRGIPEDPVTGASHCSLADYWRPILGKSSFIAYQASRRGGVLGVRIAEERVVLTGQAVTVMRGMLAT